MSTIQILVPEPITAKEAAQLSDESIFPNIMQDIRQRARWGKKQMEISYSLNETNQKKLTDLGFLLEKFGNGWIINW